MIDVDGARMLFGDGWGLIRASHTQPVLVARCEGHTPEALSRITALLGEAFIMVRTQIQLTEAQFARLKALASAKGVSRFELIRQGVEILLRLNYTGEVQRSERIQRAIEAAGRFRSGLGDLSINHDKYMAEAFNK